MKERKIGSEKERGSSCMRWMGFLLLVMLGLGIGAGCEKLDLLGAPLNVNCINDQVCRVTYIPFDVNIIAEDVF